MSEPAKKTRQMSPKRLLNTTAKTSIQVDIDRINRDVDNIVDDVSQTGMHRGQTKILDDPSYALSTDRYTPKDIKFKNNKLKQTVQYTEGNTDPDSNVDLEKAKFAMLKNLDKMGSFTTNNQWTEVYFDRHNLVVEGGDPNNNPDGLLVAPYGIVESKDRLKYCKYKTLATVLEMRSFGFPLPSIEEILLIHTSTLEQLLNEYYGARVNEIQLGGVAQFALSVIDGYQSDLQAFSRLALICEGKGDVPGALTALALKSGLREKMTNQLKDIGLLPKKPDQLIIHDTRKSHDSDADKIAAIHATRGNSNLDLGGWLAEQERKRLESLRLEDREAERRQPKQVKGLLKPKQITEEEMILEAEIDSD